MATASKKKNFTQEDEQQVEVIDLILKKHELTESVSFNHSGNFERIFS